MIWTRRLISVLSGFNFLLVGKDAALGFIYFS